MIVTAQNDRLRLVTQGDHAHLASEMLSLMRLPELVEHPRRESLLRAVREHDNGWRELDAAPWVDRRTGAPTGFRDVDGESRREVWTRGCERHREGDPYVALLITYHALALHGDRQGDEWRAWLAGLEESAGELGERAGVDRSEASRDHAWLALADACSLAVCEGRTGGFGGCGLTGRVEDEVLRLDPFPLAGATTFQLSCRRIERREYASDLELGVALARAPWEKLPIRVAPG